MPNLQVSSNLTTTGQWVTDGSANSIMSLGTDKVGIGTTAPLEPLHVYDATDNTVARFESGDTRCAVSLKDSSDTAYVGTESNKAFLGMVAALHENNIVVDSSGNVGIGTTAPVNVLDVVGDVGATGTVTAAGGFKTGASKTGITSTKVFDDDSGATHTVEVTGGIITSWTVS